MKTTIEIPDFLFKRVKAQAAMEGRKLKDVITVALNGYLTHPRRAQKKDASTCPFPLIKGKGGPLLKRMDNSTIAKILEKEDIERYRRSFRR